MGFLLVQLFLQFLHKKIVTKVVVVIVRIGVVVRIGIIQVVILRSRFLGIVNRRRGRRIFYITWIIGIKFCICAVLGGGS